MEEPEIDEEETNTTKEVETQIQGIFPFRRYTEITSYESSNIEKIIDEGFTSDKYEWVMMEKIHGANFSIITDGNQLICAKRTGILEENDKFYGYSTVIKDIKEKIFKACNLLKEEFSDFEHCAFFGELFGGMYPHPDVKKIPGISHVQKGVYYSPSIHISFFDVFVKNHSFIDYDLMEKIMTNSGLMYSVALQRGTYRELVKIDLESFVSTISGSLGLPPLSKIKNIAEGIVLKPVKNCYFSHSRVIVKYKSEQFKEVMGLKTTKIKKIRKLPPPVSFNESEQKLIDQLKCYCTENRLHNVISKIGQIKSSEKMKLSGLFIQDITKDFQADCPDLSYLSKETQKKILASVKPKAQKVIETHWEKILENEF